MALQTGAYALEQDVPNKIIFADSNYTSTSDASLNRRHTKFAPKNDTIFQPKGTREIEFQISSTTSFLDLQNMYITGKFLNRTTYGYAATATDEKETQLLAMIEKGGIDSLFETVILENASTGTTIQKMENYNTWCALHGVTYKSTNEASEVFTDEFDWSSNSLFSNPYTKGEVTNEHYYLHGANSSYACAGGAPSLHTYITLHGDLAYDIDLTAIANASTIQLTTGDQKALVLKEFIGLRVGDEFKYSYNAGAVKHFRVVHVRNLTGDASSDIVRIVCQPVGDTQAVLDNLDTSTNVLTSFWICNRGSGGNWRAYVGSSMAPDGQGDGNATVDRNSRGEVIRFTWKPKLPLFWMKKYYPLFLHASGWRLRCILDPSVFHSFYALGSPAKNVSIKFDYQLSDLRMGMVVYDFHSSINKEYLDSYKSSKGLMFPFKGVHYSGSQIPTAAGSISIQVTPGVRSARNVITRMTTNTIYSAETVASKYTPCLSAHPALGLTEYQYSSGSLVFPQRPIELDDQFQLENRKHLVIQTKKLCDRYEVTFEGSEPHNAPATIAINPWNINSFGTAYYGVYTAGSSTTMPLQIDGTNNGLMYAILSREMDGRFSGLDLSIQPLKLDMTFAKSVSSNIAANRILHTFIYYDSYLHLSEASGVTILN